MKFEEYIEQLYLRLKPKLEHNYRGINVFFNKESLEIEVKFLPSYLGTDISSKSINILKKIDTANISWVFICMPHYNYSIITFSILNKAEVERSFYLNQLL